MTFSIIGHLVSTFAPDGHVRRAARRVRAGTRQGAAHTKLWLRAGWHWVDPVVDIIDPDRKRCHPNGDDVLVNYREHFVDTARAFQLFVARCSPKNAPTSATPAAIVVMPWFATPVPWYAIAIGIGLARRGRPVVFVWHDAIFPEAARTASRENPEIGRVLGRLSSTFPILRVSEQPPAVAQTGDAEVIDQLTKSNLHWGLRGATPTPRETEFMDRIRDRLAADLLRVRSLMMAKRFDYVVVPGGVLGSSGLYLAAGRRVGTRVATFDAGLGWTEINVEGVAAQQTDTVRAFDHVRAESPERRARVIQLAGQELARRRAGTDSTSYQAARTTAPGMTTPNTVLIPLSVDFDTSALGRHHVFENTEQWLNETIRVLLDHTDDAIVVRQHPSERRWTERSNFDVAQVLSDVSTTSQIRLITAEDDANTYDLLDASRLVLPFVSTIGIEAAALGKPVVVAGSVYYASLGFVHAARSREEYLTLVCRGARGELGPMPDQVSRAWICYYLNAVCHRVFTDFTPQPPDFWRWVARRPDELYADEDVGDLLTSLDAGTPLSILRHERRFAAGAWRAPSVPSKARATSDRGTTYQSRNDEP